jgi:hypothetical protein
MRDILTIGVVSGLLTAAICLGTGGSLLFVFAGYSVGGTLSALLAAALVATMPERDALKQAN